MPRSKLKRITNSLVTRLLLLGLMMAGVGTAASYFQLTRFLRQDLIDSVATQQSALAAYVARDLDSYLGERTAFLERLAAALPTDLLQQPEALRAWLTERGRLSPASTLGLAVADPTGRRLDGAGQVDVGTPEFQGALAGRAIVGRMTAADSGHAMLPLAGALRDASGNVLAVLLASVDVTVDRRLVHLDHGRIGQTGGILVVSPRDRQFVAATDARLALRPTPAPGVNPLHDRAMDGFRGSGTTVNAFGVEEISAIASVPRSGWFVVARLPVAEALAPVGRMQTFILERRAPAVLLVLIVIGFILAWLLRPLLRAADQAKRMTRGELALSSLTVVRDDEIGQLTAAFNGLLGKLCQQQRELDRLAHSDALTGLPNRKRLLERLQAALADARQGGGTIAVLYLDLDGFKQLNDMHGHEAGDMALKEVARRLLGLVGDTDTAARIGGDEFVLLARSPGGDAEADAEAAALARRCIDAVRQPLDVGGSDIEVGVSVGIAIGCGTDTPDALLAAADRAMYRAKQAGPGRHVIATEPAGIEA